MTSCIATILRQTCFLIWLGLFAGASLAQDVPVRIAGGELDGAFSDIEVYLNTPTSAQPTGAACLATRQYVDYVNSGRYAEVPDLFSNDAVMLEPAGGILQGHEDIKRYFTKSIGDMKPKVIAVAYVGDERDCFVELSVQRNFKDELRFILVSVDHFTLGSNGKFSRMVAFARSARKH